MIELTAPECLLVEGGRVKSNVCFKMELGDTDASGRPRPIKLEGTEFEIQVDSVISAIGQRVELDFFPEKELQTDPVTRETQLPQVFAGGDAVRGASTLIRAIGDGKRVAEAVIRKAAAQFDAPSAKPGRDTEITTLQFNQARRKFGPRVPETALDRRFDFDLVTQTLDDDTAQREAGRCLQCDLMCNVCTTVCPNRANLAYRMDPVEFSIQRARRKDDKNLVEDVETIRINQSFQIINIGDFCNECGNCSTFCPTSGEPYRAKPKFYLTPESFAGEANGYMLADGVLHARVEGEPETLSRQGDHLIYETKDVQARLNSKTFAVEEITFSEQAADKIELRHAARMCLLMIALNDFYLFK